jgi:hypothetical protein
MIFKPSDDTVSPPAPRGYTGRHRAVLTPSTTSKPTRTAPNPAAATDLAG